ncbi:MAG TPA: helix-turn-helix domain-containing protein [Gemmataceae bacterium]
MDGHRRVAVHPALGALVRAVWVQEAGGAPSPGPYTVLPRPYPVAGFQFRGRLAVVRGGGETLLERAGVTGVQGAARTFVPRGDARSVLVEFEPFGAYALLGCPMSELADAHVGFSSLLPTAGDLAGRLREAETPRAAGDAVVAFLLRLLAAARREPHPAVVAAVGSIRQTDGCERIETVARRLAVGRRQLERLFLTHVGVSPKRFASLVRFEAVLRKLPGRKSWASLACELGFSDQAHLIRTFLAYTGTTPERFATDRGRR